MLFIGKKVQNCVNIPQEICRDVPVAQCKIVPTLTPRYKTVRECSRCEKYDDVVVDIEYKKNCQRLEKQNCHTEYKEVNKMRINTIFPKSNVRSVSTHRERSAGLCTRKCVTSHIIMARNARKSQSNSVKLSRY